jgi:octaprenyl-diphosphate synthase
MEFRETIALIKDDLETVEKAISEHFKSDVEAIPLIGSYLFFGGGKRIRPVMVLMSSRLCGYEGASRHIEHSCVVEFLHTATLLHDDVVDASPKRRGNPSANAKWGNEVCVLVGDFLFAKSFDIMARDGDARMLRILSDTCLRMAEGEVLQQVNICNLELSQEEYVNIVERKTAALISTCCRLGAVLGGGSSEEEERLASYGLNLGMAFQLVDDVLDYTANEEKLGKPTGTDLREGNITLPLILLYNECGPELRGRIERLVETGDVHPQDVKELIQQMEGRGIFVRVRSQAMDYIRKAKAQLSVFDNDSPYLKGLCAVADFVVDRDL